MQTTRQQSFRVEDWTTEQEKILDDVDRCRGGHWHNMKTQGDWPRTKIIHGQIVPREMANSKNGYHQ